MALSEGVWNRAGINQMLRIILESVGIYIASVLAIPATIYIGSVLLSRASGTSVALGVLAIYAISVFLIYRLLKFIMVVLR